MLRNAAVQSEDYYLNRWFFQVSPRPHTRSNRTAPRLAVIVVTVIFSLSRSIFSGNLSFYTQVCHCLAQADQDLPSPLKSLGPCKVGLARPFICPTRSILRLVHRSAETACRNAGYSNSQPRSHYVVCEGRKMHNTCYIFLEALCFLLVSLSEPPMYIAMAVPLWEVHYPTATQQQFHWGRFTIYVLCVCLHV